MRRLLAIAVAFLLFFGSAAHAEKITYMGAETQIDGALSHTKITLSFAWPNRDSITLPIFYKITNLKYDANFEGANCRAEPRTHGTDIICDISGMTSTKTTLDLEFDSSDAIVKADSSFLFKQELYAPMNISSLWYQVVLPEGSGLVEGGNSYLPPDGETASDGRRIFVFWKRAGLMEGETFLSQINYEPVALASQAQPVYIAAVVIFAAAAVIYVVYKRRKITPPEVKTEVKMVLPVLKEDEKLVVNSLIKHDGYADQRVIVKESGYSKAKVSKVLKSLAERSLVRLERVGRANKVYLTKDIKKEEQNSSGNNQSQ